MPLHIWPRTSSASALRSATENPASIGIPAFHWKYAVSAIDVFAGTVAFGE